MAIWVTPWLVNQSSRANKSAVIVPKERRCRRTLPSGSVSKRQATTVFLWTSRPQQRACTTCIFPPGRWADERHGRAGCAERQVSLPCSSPRRRQQSWLLEASRSQLFSRADGTGKVATFDTTVRGVSRQGFSLSWLSDQDIML